MNKRLFLILLLGLTLRLAGISFGLPHLYHADEPIVVNHALAYGSGDLNPHFFNIPPLTSYILFIFYGIYFVIGLLAGQFQGVQDFERLFYTDPSSFYLIARVTLGALLGTASIAIFYRMLKKHFGVLHAEIAALLFAIYFLHVRDSHYVYADIPLVFTMILSFSFMLNFMDRPSLKNCLLTGFAIGAASAFKYNGAVLWIPFGFILAALHSNGIWKKSILSMGLCAATFILLNPFALLDAPYFIQELAEQGKSQGGAGWTHHFRYSLAGSAGFPLLAAACSGLLLVFWKKDLKRIMFASFALTYYAVLAFAGQSYDRYVLPLVPVCVFFAADFIISASQSSNGLRKGVLFLLLIGVSVPTLSRCFSWIFLMQAKDVRTEAKEWIERHIPPGEAIALDWDFFMPRLRMSQGQLEARKRAAHETSHFSEIQKRRLDLMIHRAAPGIPQYELYTLDENLNTSPTAFLFEKSKIDYDLNLLKSKGIRTVIIGAHAQDRDSSPHSFYSDLRAQGTLIAEFTPYKDPQRRRPLDEQPLTGGPFLLQDIKARKSNGQPLQVYKIQ